MLRIGQIEASATSDGKYTDGNVATGISSTRLRAAAFNALQEEICSVIEGAGITLDEAQHDQLYKAIASLISSGMSDALICSKNLSDIEDKESARDNLGVVAKSGDKMTGQLKINAANALRIFDTDYGLIFRRSENNLWMIPTIKGQGENGDIGELRPFCIDLSTGLVTMGNSAKVEGSLGLGTESILGDNSIALGDNDTGFKQNGDGVLAVHTNGQQVFGFTTNTAVSYRQVAYVPAGLPVGCGAYVDQLNNGSAPFLQSNWGWDPSAGGCYVPIVKGLSVRNGQGYPAAVSFGYLLQEQMSFPVANIHIKGDNVDALWSFNPNTKEFAAAGRVVPADWSNFDSRYPSGDWISAVGLVSNDENSPYMRSRASNNLVYLATRDFVNSRSAVAGSRDAWWYKDEATGFIIQGGVVNRSGYVTWVGFPRAYVRECFSVQMTLTYTYGSLGNSGTNIQARDVGNTGFNACMCDNEVSAYWFAVGV